MSTEIRIALLVIASIAEFTGTLLYVIDIFRGNTKPHRMTRFIVFFILSLSCFSILASDGNFGAKLYATYGFIHGGILFGASMWRGMGGTSRLDWICLAIASIGIIGWQVTGNPMVGVWFSIIADLAAYIPAFVKTYQLPETESHWLYSLGLLASGLTLIAYPLDAVSIFQIYIIVSCIIMLVLIFRKQIGWKLPFR